MFEQVSPRASSHGLLNLNRRDAFEYRLPQTKIFGGRARLKCSADLKPVTDPFALDFLPPISVLTKWREELNHHQIERSEYLYKEQGKLRFDLESVDDMLKIHSTRDIKRAVSEELSWFSRPYAEPQDVREYPSESSIDDFGRLLYTGRFDRVLPSYEMTPNEMSQLIGDRWITSDYMSWMAKTLNREQNTTYCNVLNFIGDANRLVSRLGNNIPRRCFFFVNVGRLTSRKTILGEDIQRGCHWAICYVDCAKKQIVYGDTLGWALPEDLMDKLDFVTRAFFGEEARSYHLRICHDPQSITSQGVHVCGNSCSPQYPLQGCANICGVISMVMGAVACFSEELFTHLISR